MAEQNESFEFKAEIQQLLSILVHSLYTEREIFLRELISNASDALNRIQFEMLTNREVLEPGAELAIRIEADEEARTLTISDTGIGMTRDEIAQDLGTIAHSGAAAFLRRLEEEERPSVEMIGQFGVGFYSVFMVAKEVRVVSRSYRPDAEAVEWVSDGSTSYRLGPAKMDTRGTRIEIKLKEDAVEFASPWRLEQIVRKHSDFVAFPIYVGDSKEPANRRIAPWRQSPREVTDEEYREFYKHLTLDFEEPLLHIHLVTDAPVNLRSILYVPARRERGILSPRTDHGLRLYIRNVLIQEYNKDLLPSYLRFVEGVVESEDLPLNISRETVQASPAARRIQKALTRKLLRELEALGQEEPDRYRTLWQEFGVFIKEGIASDPPAQKDLLPLLLFPSTRSDGGLISLAQYVERMADDQPAIYYVLGDDLKSVVHSPQRGHGCRTRGRFQPPGGPLCPGLGRPGPGGARISGPHGQPLPAGTARQCARRRYVAPLSLPGPGVRSTQAYPGDQPLPPDHRQPGPPGERESSTRPSSNSLRTNCSWKGCIPTRPRWSPASNS